LFDVRPSDPQILAAVFVILTLAASLAACIPARRAAGVQPMRALSEE
jgi:ABC-type lipoprotein release transport system permease subunit